MALDIDPRSAEEFQHICPLPWPVDPEVPEGHVCECGRRWLYQPARWDPLLTLDELRMHQETGAFLRGIIPTFEHPPDILGGGGRVGRDGRYRADPSVRSV